MRFSAATETGADNIYNNYNNDNNNIDNNYNYNKS